MNSAITHSRPVTGKVGLNNPRITPTRPTTPEGSERLKHGFAVRGYELAFPFAMSKLIWLFWFVLAVCTSVRQVQAQPLPDSITAQLKSPFFEHLYAHTYYSLLNRLGKDGFLPESITGAYEGMYCRTTGPLVALLLETGRLKEAERAINCVLRATRQHHLERIPHVIGQTKSSYSLISDEPQIDGQAHVLLAWARLALHRGHTPFEDQT